MQYIPISLLRMMKKRAVDTIIVKARSDSTTVAITERTELASMVETGSELGGYRIVS